MKKILSGLACVCLFSFVCWNTAGATRFYLDTQSSTITASGTSNLHPWTVQATNLQGSLIAVITSGALVSVDSGHIQLAVKSLKSGKRSMDQNIYASLKAAQHPQITFLLKKCIVLPNQLEISGVMTIAGKPKNIFVKSPYTIAADRVTMRGNFEINMDDYDVQPPRFMLGAFKSGKIVVINYVLSFNSR